MKKTLILIISILFSQIAFSQSSGLKSIEAKLADQLVESNGYPGSHHPSLIAKEKKIAEFLELNPDAKRVSLAKPAAWGFSVGDTHSWWADYFEEQDGGELQYQVPSTCRAVGTNCYVFVEDSAWNTLIDQTAVDNIIAEFDNTIFPTDVATFGTPPDVDSDPKIIILVLDIQDGNDPSSYVAGYFYSLNEVADTPGDDGNRSNEAEIFYMDCYPADPLNDPIGVFGTTAHEFQHMIHYAHGYPEMTFVNEGLSEIASYICGYGLRSTGLYAQNTNVGLFPWDEIGNVLADYSRAANWTLYLYEQFGGSILQDFVDGKHSTWIDMDNTIRPHHSPGFWALIVDWWIANYANGHSNDGKHGYTYSPISRPTPAASIVGNSGAGSGTVEPMGVEYISFTGGDDLTINFTGNQYTNVKALEIGSLKVEDVPLGTDFKVNGYGTTYPEVTFMIYSSSPGSSAPYTYVATGGNVAVNIEIAYEDGTSDGTFGWNTGDSIAVIFTGVSGAKLDSIKTYFHGTGKISMDISKWTGNTSVPLRGENMFTSVPPGHINVQNNQAWHKIDLTNNDLDATDDFVVNYTLGADPSNPNIGVRSMPDNGEYHSRTYTNNGGTTQWWVFYTDGPPAGYWNYLIRAYASIGGNTVAIDPSGIVTIPNDFSLGANYPNPFNPSTTFEFATPNDGVVNFTVYDLLGQVIYTENRTLFAGNYEFTWDGQNQLNQQVVSGVYFLKMEADGFTQTRKMLMMK